MIIILMDEFRNGSEINNREIKRRYNSNINEKEKKYTENIFKIIYLRRRSCGCSVCIRRFLWRLRLILWWSLFRIGALTSWLLRLRLVFQLLFVRSILLLLVFSSVCRWLRLSHVFDRRMSVVLVVVAVLIVPVVLSRFVIVVPVRSIVVVISRRILNMR